METPEGATDVETQKDAVAKMGDGSVADEMGAGSETGDAEIIISHSHNDTGMWEIL